MTAMPQTLPAPTVFVVDDDDAVRASVVNLLESDGYLVRSFACARTFLALALPLEPACLVLDMHMPTIDGLDVVAELARQGAGIPVIFLTGFGSIPLSVQAMKAGAIEFLTKPGLHRQGNRAEAGPARAAARRRARRARRRDRPAGAAA
jgi:FixJ family two-component response regulator